MTEFKTESVKVDGNEMVKLTINGQEFVFDLDTADRMGQSLTMMAELPGQLEHIDQVFDGWGNGGGESW